MQSLFLRFFLYLIIAIIFLVTEDNMKKRMAFIISMFCIYLVYSFIETRSIIKVFNTKK